MLDCTGNIHIHCEYCGSEYDHVAQYAVTKKDNPELAASIVNDEFFYAVCPHCHRMTGVDHPVVYTDMDKKALIAYFDSDIEFGLAQAQMTEWMGEFKVSSKFSTVRIVSTQNELREKIILLNNGLDDRLIEIIKLWTLQKLRERGHEQNFEEMRCSVLEDGYLNVDFVGDRPMHMRVDRSYYTQMLDVMKTALEQIETPLEVSTEWAVEFTTKNN